jgi:glycosyltransferase involved in cell wall biosynthesis
MTPRTPAAPNSPVPRGPSPKVSVSMVTYNHEKFIGQAIESVLMQKTDFPFELVIGEDCSSDRTREIVRNFQDRHPSVVHPLLWEYNLGGIENYVETLRACRGEYVALLDGDDYWTSSLKLQKQVEFLDSRPDFVICYHDVLKFHDDGRAESRLISERVKRIETLEDLLAVCPPSCSVMYRRGLFDDFPEWFHGVELGDWALHIMNARRGRIGYMDEVMAAHRLHGGGVYSSLGKLARLKAKIQVYDRVGPYLGPRYRRLVRRLKSHCFYRMALESEGMGQSANARAYIREAFFVRPFRDYASARELFGAVVWLHLPFVHRLVRGAVKGKKASSRSAGNDAT